MTGSDEDDIVRVIDQRPTPRTLILSDDDEFAVNVSTLMETSRRIAAASDVRAAEFDLLIATRPFASAYSGPANPVASEPATHLFIISFGGTSLGSYADSYRAERSSPSIKFVQRSIAREYQLPAGVPLEFRSLVETDLLPAVRRRNGQHSVLLAPDSDGASQVHPLLETTEGLPLAGLVRRRGESMILALPDDVTDREGWVRAALKYFRAFAPARFESIPGWEDRDSWSTAAEQQLRARLQGLRTERERLVAELAQQESRVSRQLAESSADAERGLRRLLTAQGQDLVDAVIEALQDLGFEVVDVDAQSDPQNKLEDLRVKEPGVDWEALVEVRGYTRGAKLNDLLRTERFVRRYRDDTDRWPTAVWYIVNQFAGRDPELRPAVLQSQEEDLEEWATDNAGLAMDTSELFRLAVDVKGGRVTAAEARRRLRDGRLRYQHGNDPAGGNTGESGDGQNPSASRATAIEPSSDGDA